jgi:hypothetical protein
LRSAPAKIKAVNIMPPIITNPWLMEYPIARGKAIVSAAYTEVLTTPSRISFLNCSKSLINRAPCRVSIGSKYTQRYVNFLSIHTVVWVSNLLNIEVVHIFKCVVVFGWKVFGARIALDWSGYGWKMEDVGLPESFILEAYLGQHAVTF